MVAAILVLMIIPFSNTSYIRNTTYRPIFKFFFLLFITDCIILTWVGQMPVRTAFVFTGQIATVYYFLFFLFAIPIISKIETILATWVVSDSLCTEPLYCYTFDDSSDSDDESSKCVCIYVHINGDSTRIFKHASGEYSYIFEKKNVDNPCIFEQGSDYCVIQHGNGNYTYVSKDASGKMSYDTCTFEYYEEDYHYTYTYTYR